MRRVLVIDDEPAIRYTLTRVLEKAGFRVTTAEGGAVGLETLRASDFDVVITDIMMPQMHGVDAISAIVREFARIRIIAISGGGNFGVTKYKPDALTTSAYLAAAKRAGAHALLTKPFRTAELLQTISDVSETDSRH